MRGKEFRARDKKVQKLTRDGLVERNQATGEESRISQRTADISFRPERTQEQALKRPEASRARNKQKRKQQAKNISAKIRAEMSLTEVASDLITQMQTGLAESENTEFIISSENLSDNAEFDSPPVMRDA